MRIKPVIEVCEVGTLWPSGRSKPLAQLQVDDDWVQAITGTTLVTGFEEGLGPWTGTGGKLPSGTCVELLRHDLAGPLYALFVDDAANVKDALEEFLAVTNLEPSAIRWRHPEVPLEPK